MAYCELQDLIDRFGERELIDAADRDGEQQLKFLLLFEGIF